ncbi:DUF3054 domain-containing protein [Leucobacter chromiiresistens]
MSAATGRRHRSGPSTSGRAVAIALAIDVVFVLLFAGIGRSSHARAETLLGLLGTAWPFLAGLGIAWLAALAVRRPLAIVRTGLPVWAGAVIIGMLLRAATGAGTAPSFIVVTAVTLGVFLVGWRAIAALLLRLRVRTSR